MSDDFRMLATELAHMARDLLDRESVQETLDGIATYAAKLVEGCESASVMVIRKGEPGTVAASSEVARAADEAQARLSEGPCFEAANGHEQMYRINDLSAAADRWPRFAGVAAGLGVESVMGFMLYTDAGNSLGAVNMYSANPGAFSEAAGHMGWVMASHAAVALASAWHAKNMESALASSRVIGEAIGVVMSQYRLTEEAAFAAIQQISQNHNIRVRDLAGTITTTGELPAPRRRLLPHEGGRHGDQSGSG